LSRFFVGEQVFRYNNRATTENPHHDDLYRFKTAISEMLGGRLIDADLPGKSDSPHQETTGTGQAAEIAEPF